jgi:hypothetical protein
MHMPTPQQHAPGRPGNRDERRPKGPGPRVAGDRRVALPCTVKPVNGTGHLHAPAGPITGGSTFTVRATSGMESVAQNISLLLYK